MQFRCYVFFFFFFFGSGHLNRGFFRGLNVSKEPTKSMSFAFASPAKSNVNSTCDQFSGECSAPAVPLLHISILCVPIFSQEGNFL